MKAEFVNPFVEAVHCVLAADAPVKMSKGALSLQTNPQTTLPVTVLLAVEGKVRGIVLYSMKVETALAIVSTMLGQPLEKLDELAQSGIAEMGNVMTGTALASLSRAGYEAQLSVPTLILGHGVTISTLDVMRIVVPLETQYGLIEVHLALREAN